MKSIAVSGVKTIETHWIPMVDGRRLAARLFLPDTAEAQPVPLILEYIPYRRRDFTRTGDEEMHLWFAARGFACARVDIAGTGDSEGVLQDEYVKREQDDALEIFDHLCTQSWCTGVAGMIGISWGGFNALQVAARRPKQLKAIISLCAADDRYGCDAHYSGGCLINDNFGWGGALFGYAALPPDPAVVGEDRWREIWRQRLDDHSLYPATWLKHQRRDAFWKQGSVCEDYSAVTCPVLTVGGWLDGYTPTMFRLVENLPGVVKGICGPWGHKEPHQGVPGPAIGYLQECARWFSHWLKGEDHGVEADPAMRLWLMDYAKPSSHMLDRPGRWLGIQNWPSSALKISRLHLHENTLQPIRPNAACEKRTISSPLTTGLRGQEWCPYGQGRIAPEGAMDQREDDSGSITFDSQPLADDRSLVGEAIVTLSIAADKPQAMVAVRLTDVAPDGTSALITYAVLNLSHRESSEHPRKLIAGEFETVVIRMKPVAQVVPQGHRIRIAVSSSYWPLAWPAPEVVTLIIDPHNSHIDLPVLRDEKSELVDVKFESPVHATPGLVTVKEPAQQSRTIVTDVGAELTTLTAMSNDGRYVISETNTEITSWRRKVYSIDRNNPTTCVSTVTCHAEFTRADWNVRVESEVNATCDSVNFYVRGWVKAYERGTVFAERTYEEVIPRDYM
jgi:uncharacterized protein